MAKIAQTSQFASIPDLVIPNVDCDPGVIVGDWVRINGSNIAVKALADNFNNSNVLGLVEAKSTATLCNIRVLGVSEPIFSSLDPTQEYLLSDTTAGQMTLTVPTIAGHIVLKLGQPFSDTRFLVLKGQRIERA